MKGLGQILQITCTNCTYETKLFIGGGRQDCNPKIMLSAAPKEQRAALEEAIQQGTSGISILRIPTACAACGTIYTAAIVRYRLHGKQKEIHGVCPQCGAQDTKTSLSCPLCHAAVTQKQIGHWD